MQKKVLLISCCIALIGLGSSCKKSDNATPSASAAASVTSLATLGLYEYGSGSNKRIFIPITKVGTQAVNYYGIFDTGSSGLTLDANGIIPASMITSAGIQFTGDSVNVNGMTIMATQATVSYGDKTGTTKEYGNLAYAPITLGDANGNITTKRIPIFLYYKIMNVTAGTQLPAHSADVFGVGPGKNFANLPIASPLSYFDLGAGLTSGFRLAMLKAGSFSSTGTFVSGLLSIGLTPTDLSSSGFIMHPLTYTSANSYSPNIPATITYNGHSIAAQVLFDTGTPSVSVIENTLATTSTLTANTTVTVTTNKGFTYTYTTADASNITAVENPNVTGDYRTIFSLDFFVSNEILTDYTNHQIGLKNN
jgi:hypothetical protein